MAAGEWRGVSTATDDVSVFFEGGILSGICYFGLHFCLGIESLYRDEPAINIESESRKVHRKLKVE
jgi:hypothetical protein